MLLQIWLTILKNIRLISYISEQHSYNTSALANKNLSIKGVIKHSRLNIQYTVDHFLDLEPNCEIIFHKLSDQFLKKYFKRKIKAHFLQHLNDNGNYPEAEKLIDVLPRMSNN